MLMNNRNDRNAYQSRSYKIGGAAFRHPAPDTGSGQEGTKLRKITFWLSSAEGLQTKREEIS
jgi:hypothetical protein